MADVDDLLARLAQGLARARRQRAAPARPAVPGRRGHPRAATVGRSPWPTPTSSGSPCAPPTTPPCCSRRPRTSSARVPGPTPSPPVPYARFDLLDVDGPDPRWPLLESESLTALAPARRARAADGRGRRAGHRRAHPLPARHRPRHRPRRRPHRGPGHRGRPARRRPEPCTRPGQGPWSGAGRGAPGHRHGRRPARACPRTTPSRCCAPTPTRTTRASGARRTTSSPATLTFSANPDQEIEST